MSCNGGWSQFSRPGALADRAVVPGSSDPEVLFGYGFGSAVRSAILPRFTITMTATIVMMMA
jgi:hypothetical protein